MAGITVGIPVWGEVYSRNFLNYTLPSILAPNNLPALAEMFDVEVVLFTTVDSAPRLLTHPAYARLQQICRATIRTADVTEAMIAEIGKVYTTFHHRVMNMFHGVLYGEYPLQNRGIISLCSDVILSDGSLGVLGEKVKAGYTKLLNTGLGAVEETFLPELDPFRSECELSISVADLTRIALRHLHPWTESMSVASERFTYEPSFLLWPCDEGYIIRSYLTGPIFSYFGPRKPTLNHAETYDVYVFGSNLSANDRIATLDARDGFCQFEYSRLVHPTKPYDGVLRRYSTEDYLYFIIGARFQEHVVNLKYTICVVPDPLQSNLEEVISESDEECERILNLLEHYTSSNSPQ